MKKLKKRGEIINHFSTTCYQLFARPHVEANRRAVCSEYKNMKEAIFPRTRQRFLESALTAVPP
jgi:uncharacterized protein (DUF488 family)